MGFTFAQERVRISPLQSIPFSVSYNVESVRLIVQTLKNWCSRARGVRRDRPGGHGIRHFRRSRSRAASTSIWSLLALISVNLGVMNLLPIPGLDGSRLLFLLVEAVRRKPVKRELEGAIHGAGFILLMALMVALTYKDIMQIFVR